MFTHILLPLDGSTLAEAAIAPVAGLAREANARVTLFHVIEQHPPKEVHHEKHLSDPDDAAGYLDAVAGRFFADCAHVDCHVHTAAVQDVGRSIVAHAEELDCDLVAMCTHGRGGLRRWVSGSIAQHVIAAGPTPVLVVPARPEARSAEFAWRRILAPLDGDEAHEKALPLVMDLAGTFGADVCLLTVVATLTHLAGERIGPAQVLPATMRNLLEMEAESAAEYLQQKADRLGRTDVTVQTQVRRGKAPAEILEACSDLDVDLVILATHRKIGLKAFWSASVAPWVLNRAETPILLLPLAG